MARSLVEHQNSFDLVKLKLFIFDSSGVSIDMFISVLTFFVCKLDGMRVLIKLCLLNKRSQSTVDTGIVRARVMSL